MFDSLGLTALALAPFSFCSWAMSSVAIEASWESIDYILIGMSVVFMACYKYSELWLQLTVDPRNYVILEQSKYWLASIGQWFLQNMAHACVFSIVGKILMFGAVLRYIDEIRKEKQQNILHCSVKIDNF